jgi:hypothetical protein
MASEQPPHELEIGGSTIVLLGAFNPRIFQPMWFEARGLLADVDVDPNSLVLTDGFVSFETGVVSVFCARDRCQFATTDKTPTPDIIRDLAVGTFTLLGETPVWEVGVNHATHIPRQRRRWDDVVAQFGDPQKSLVLLTDQALQTVALVAPRDDGREGQRTVQLQPSARLEEGVWFTMNDHVVVYPVDARESIGAKEAVEAMEGIWDSSRELSDEIHNRLASR